jgi:hypothetical protein
LRERASSSCRRRARPTTEHEDAGRERIERAAVADLAGAEPLAGVVDGVARGDAGGLVEDDDSVGERPWALRAMPRADVAEAGSNSLPPRRGEPGFLRIVRERLNRRESPEVTGPRESGDRAMGALLLASLALCVGGDEIHPTLAEIFKPPRLLGARPQDLAISASGSFVLGAAPRTDAEQPKLDWWLAPPTAAASRASLPGRAARRAPVVAARRRAARPARRLDRPDGPSAARPPRRAPSGRSSNAASAPRELTFTRDGDRALLTAGEDNELWVLDLASGARWSPASALKNRGRWFQVLEECDQIALFAAAPDAGGAAPAAPPRRPRPPRRRPTRRSASSGSCRSRRAVRRGRRSSRRATGSRSRPTAASRRSPTSSRRRGASSCSPDYLTESVTTVPVRDNVAGDQVAPTTLALYDFGAEQRVAPALDEGSRFMLLDTLWSPTGSRLLVHA